VSFAYHESFLLGGDTLLSRKLVTITRAAVAVSKRSVEIVNARRMFKR
jgi:hypothetical protein